MAHGGYEKRRVVTNRRSKGVGGVSNTTKKPKSVSIKNQIRSIERMLRKQPLFVYFRLDEVPVIVKSLSFWVVLIRDLPSEVREAQEKKLEGFKKQQDIHTRLAVERKIFLRGRKIKFFERRKVERRLRRLEKQQRTSSGQANDAQTSEQLAKLKEDLEYVRFFPKTEKYVSLFTGGDNSDVVDKRNKLRKQIKANLIAAVASGKDLEETGSEDDGLLDISEDDFFLGSSSDEGDADDELTDKSTREQASSASGKATSGMSSDERNQKRVSARALMPPPRPTNNPSSNSARAQSRFGPSSSKRPSTQRTEIFTPSNTSNRPSSSKRPSIQQTEISMPSNTSTNVDVSSYQAREYPNSRTDHNSSNISSNSDAQKPRRKRKHRKKKKQAGVLSL
ncbi:hypothetical protein ACFE04_011605 [Oxalis oulophora]